MLRLGIATDKTALGHIPVCEAKICSVVYRSGISASDERFQKTNLCCIDLTKNRAENGGWRLSASIW